ncbi:MAG: serpin family protein [Armatimonadetes bacterium]|nr:serpin family protein [Armatimonadota bacterium]
MKNVIINQPALRHTSQNISSRRLPSEVESQASPKDLYFSKTWSPPEIASRGATGCTFVGDPEGEAQKVAEENGRFAVELYSRLAAKTEGNLFFAPFGISTALAMTYAGANGETSKEMGGVLHFNEFPKENLHQAFGRVAKDLTSRLDREDCTFTVANRIWTQDGARVEEKFQKTVGDAYGALAETLDFKDSQAATETINSWVAEKTKDRIRNLIPPCVLNEDTPMVLTNALYFKADWACKFDPRHTFDAPFQTRERQSIVTPTMHQTGTFRYGEFYLDNEKPPSSVNRPFFVDSPDVQVLELPYAGGDLSMVFILPKDQETLSKVEKSLDPDQVSNWLGGLSDKKVVTSIPKFNLTSSFKMKEILSEMGMGRAFSAGADFSGINGEKNLSIGDVIHKATVEVNEQGAEGGAGTAVVVLESFKRDPDFSADRPFLFAIRDRNAGILCMGRVSDPTRTE